MTDDISLTSPCVKDNQITKMEVKQTKLSNHKTNFYSAKSETLTFIEVKADH